MRKVAVGVVGLFCGLLVGFAATEIIVRPVVSSGSTPPAGLGLLLGFLSPALAVVGVIVAIVVDERNRRRD